MAAAAHNVTPICVLVCMCVCVVGRMMEVVCYAGMVMEVRDGDPSGRLEMLLVAPWMLTVSSCLYIPLVDLSLLFAATLFTVKLTFYDRVLLHTMGHI